LGGAVRGWLAVSSFSYPAFAVLLGAVIIKANLKTSDLTTTNYALPEQHVTAKRT